MTIFQQNEIEKRIDILEDDIADIDPIILRILLKDKTTRKNILWCTKDYAFSENANVSVSGGTRFVKYYATIDEVMDRIQKELEKYPESKVYLSTPPVIPGLGTAGG